MLNEMAHRYPPGSRRFWVDRAGTRVDGLSKSLTALVLGEV
jgi:hypothetical protein